MALQLSTIPSALPSLEELPDFLILETVLERREFTLLRARERDGGESRLVQVFASLLPGSNTYARLKHGSQRVYEAAGRGILRILEIRAGSGRVCLIREDFRGQPLDVFLNAQHLDLRERLSLAVSLVSILEKIHRGEMAHLSLSPDNILVDPADHRIKLWNCFGETREGNPNALGSEADRILPYRAPEQFGRLNRAVDQRADLYACGIVIYQILTRRLPFHVRSPEDWIYCHLARTPIAPETWEPAIPPVLSQIVLKLLAKDPDDRYQTAHGLQLDLEDCREQWDESGKIQVLSHSGNTRRGEFFLPQRLYGREMELGLLGAAWENMSPGNPAVVLVSGAAGMGKSGLIHEWSSSLPSGTLLARGKFEQANRASPFSAWRGAFADLLDQLLTGSAASIGRLKSRAGEFLGPSAVLAGELLPELSSLLEPGAPADSGSEQAGSRLLAGLERFLAAIPENRGGLVVFLDDMQWADEASMKLFRDLAASRDFPRLCLIGACRISGSDAKDALDALWERMGRPGKGRFHPIRLSPISKQTMQAFIGDALGADAASASLASLAALVHMKSHGNPFHMREILTYLHRERILRYAPAEGWRWDLGRLAKAEDGFTLNNLVAERWVRMTAWEREILQLSACAGTGPLLDDLIKVTGRKREDLLEALEGPLRLGFLQPSAGDYRFAHDRLWEAVYFQLPETQRVRMHARIARGLLGSGEQDAFKIVRHLQAADPADHQPGDRLAISRIYLEAAARSKVSVSPAAALELYEAGRKTAGPEAWREDRALAMDLALGCMESAYLRGAMAIGDASFAGIRGHCSDPLELTRAYAARMTSLGEANALESAVACLREGLSLLGAGLPVEPDEIESAIRIELAKAARLKEGRSLRDFAEAPQITDVGFLAVTDLLSRSAMILFYSDQNLLTLVQLKMVNLILEFGNTLQSPFAYLAYGWILAAEGEDFASAYAFGKLAVESVAGRGGAYQGCMLEEIHASMIKHWTRPFRECADMLRHAFHVGRETGDLHYALLGQLNRLGMLLIAGEPLERLDEEFRSHAPLYERMGNAYPAFLFWLRWSQVRSLRGTGGLLQEPASVNPGDGSALESGNRLARFNHHHVGEILAYFEGDMDMARQHSLAAELYRGRANALPAVAEHAFYSAMILASRSGGIAGGGDLEREFDMYCGRLARWAEACPGNYRARHLLAMAELRLARGLHGEAESLYREAAREAGRQGQIQIEALAFERCGLHFLERGQILAAEACLSQALRAYSHWGAGAKADRMLAAHPHLRAEVRGGKASPPPARSDGGGVRDGILDQVLKASRALSAEVSPEPLLKRLMAILMEVSGAQKGCLLIQEEDALILAAESEESGRACMRRRAEAEAPEALAWSAARFVNRNGRLLVLEDAHREGLFREDAHVRAAAVRSLLCLPVCAEGGRRGILYLENNALPGAFTPGRTELLELIAAQAAISLRNSDLYEQARNLASHLQTVRESERRNVAREVHDELGHALTALHLDLAWLALKGPRESPDFAEKVRSMSRLVETTVQSVQRIISDLRPAVLDQLGLCEALEWQVSELGKRTGLECHLDLPESNPDLPVEAAAALFRILQEGISNVLRHAEAKRIWVRLFPGAGSAGRDLRLEIRDDGKGITPAQVGHPLSFGLAGMRERLRPWDGELRVAACEGGGTLVAAVLPMRSGSKNA